MPEVWEWVGDRPSGFAPDRWALEIPLAPGLVYTVDKDLTDTREDFTGSQSAVRGALKPWTQTFRKVAESAEANAIIDFIHAREADGASFYWYVPFLTAPPDASGVTVKGRLLVRIPPGKWSLEHVSKVKQIRITVTFELVLS